MKFYPKIMILATIALLFAQCTDSNTNKFNDPDVKLFVQQIQLGRYITKSPSGYLEVPVFEKEDIPALLFYAKDHTPVKDFPVNPISSINKKNYRLSQCLLWTIEKVRIGNYPSLTPSLMKKDKLTGKYNIVSGLTDIDEVWKLYENWWKQAENQPISSEIYTNNPLSGTAYLWY
jgi:hypothetical protein